MTRSSRYSDEQKKKNMLAKLVVRRNVGEKYTPKEKIYSSIPKDARGNLEQLLDELHKDGYLEYHKNKACVSIHRRNKEKVRSYLKDAVPAYYWDNF